MNAPRSLQEILDDLYAIEPALRAQDAVLRSLVEKMVAARPEAAIDERFVAQLRRQLMAARPAPAGNAIARFLSGGTAWYLAPGMAALVLALAVTISLAPRTGPGTPERTLALATGVERLGAEAFGPLSDRPVAQDAQSSNAPLGAGTAGASGSAAPSLAPAPLPPDAGGGEGLAASKTLRPVDWTPIVYTYAYRGDAIEGLAPQVDVYRHVKDAPGAGSLSALKGLGLGLVDFGKLVRPEVQSFTLVEDRQDGYGVSVDVAAGMVNVFENAQRTYPERLCQDQACMERYRLKESDMPSDAEAIRMADDMLDALGISREGYGAPSVHDDWHAQYLASADKTAFWFPDTVMVTYPYLIDGKAVQDEYGAPFGMNVNVDVRHKRGASLWNLASRRFQASSYAAETDAKRLIGIAEQGGVGGVTEVPDGAKVVEIRLGTPKVMYTRVWQQGAEGGVELFAPALVFPVIDPPQGFWQTSVSVPLAQDLLKAGAAPVPMPLIQNK